MMAATPRATHTASATPIPTHPSSATHGWHNSHKFAAEARSPRATDATNPIGYAAASFVTKNGDTLVLIASATAEQEMPKLIPKMKLFGYGNNGYRILTMSLPIEAVRKELLLRRDRENSETA